MSIRTALGELSLAKHHFFLNTGLFDQSNSIDIKYLAEAFLIGLYDILRHTHTKISTMKKKVCIGSESDSIYVNYRYPKVNVNEMLLTQGSIPMKVLSGWFWPTVTQASLS